MSRTKIKSWELQALLCSRFLLLMMLATLYMEILTKNLSSDTKLCNLCFQFQRKSCKSIHDCKGDAYLCDKDTGVCRSPQEIFAKTAKRVSSTLLESSLLLNNVALLCVERRNMGFIKTDTSISSSEDLKYPLTNSSGQLLDLHMLCTMQ